MKNKKLLIIPGMLALVLSGCNSNEKWYKSLEVKKVTDYLYEAKLDYDFDFSVANKNFANYKQGIGGCSAITIGNLRGRNYDWEFSNGTSFAVRTTKKEGRHASIGLASLTGLSNDKPQDGKYHVEYEMLPFTTLDAINDAGIYVNVNVVPYQSLGAWSLKNEDESDDMCELCGPRLIADKCEYLTDIIPLFDTYDWYCLGTEEETHLMVTGPRSKEDKTQTTVVFEFVPFATNGKNTRKLCMISNNIEDKKIVNDDSRFYLSPAKNLIMTNFNLWYFDPSLSRDEQLGDGEGSVISEPMGFERYEILNTAGGDKKEITKQEMFDLMKRVYYSKAYNLYQNDFWYSEYKLTKEDLRKVSYDERFPMGDYEKLYKGNADSTKLIKDQIGKWNNRDRELGSKQGLWETLHTSVFDYKTSSFSVIVREGNISYDFTL